MVGETEVVGGVKVVGETEVVGRVNVVGGAEEDLLQDRVGSEF